MRTVCFYARASFCGKKGILRTRVHHEAQEETLKMLEVYRSFAEDVMAMPVICGGKRRLKNFQERFIRIASKP